MPFELYYQNRVDQFTANGLFDERHPIHAAIEWPPGACGVYAIWRKESSKKKDLIYIGSQGSFERNEDHVVVFVPAPFQALVNRYTPFRFCQNVIRDHAFRYHFRYRPAPNFVPQARYNDDAYMVSIPYAELVIDFFIIDANHENYTPELLKTEMLTHYLKTYQTLPPANNKL